MAIAIKEIPLVGGEITYEMYGLSTDTKPANAPNAAIFYEMDTQNVFMFSQPENGAGEWIEQ